jgi:hypothetical protein
LIALFRFAVGVRNRLWILEAFAVHQTVEIQAVLARSGEAGRPLKPLKVQPVLPTGASVIGCCLAKLAVSLSAMDGPFAPDYFLVRSAARRTFDPSSSPSANDTGSLISPPTNRPKISQQSEAFQELQLYLRMPICSIFDSETAFFSRASYFVFLV